MSEPGPSPTLPPQRRARRLTESLAARLFALTLGAILLTEALIFVPSASNVRTQWLGERVQAARIAALALEVDSRIFGIVYGPVCQPGNL